MSTLKPTVETDDYRYDRTLLKTKQDSEGPVVLNLGCGRDERGIGLDINYDPDIHHDLNDGIPVADDAVDVVLAEHVLEHLDDPGQALQEIARVLRPDGRAEIELPNAGWLPVRLWASQDLHRFWEHKNPDKSGHWLARRLGNDDERRTEHKTLWTPALAESRLEDVGLDADISGSHWSRNISVTARPETADEESASTTLHELERGAGSDMASGDYWAQTRARIMADWVREFGPGTVLDIGCGSGYLTARIADANPRGQTVGMDKDRGSIAVARRRDTSARFEVADAHDLPFEDSSQDCVIFGDVLEHFEDPVPLLREAARVIRPDGRVIVSVPAFRSLMGPHDAANDHADRYNRDRLAETVGAAGFDIRRSQYTNALPLPLYFIYQRVLKRQVPGSARGGHGGLVELAKRGLIELEASVEMPAGITLLAELEVTSAW